jgi:tetratricopeptide (TPR) repeat protein
MLASVMKRSNNLRKPIAKALLLASIGFTSACANTPILSDSIEFLRGRGAAQESNSLFGRYLAARHAGVIRDTGSAAEYYAQALKFDPDNEVIMDRAFLLELADGRIYAATQRGASILTQRPEKRLPQLVLGLSDLKIGSYASALERFEKSADGPFTSLASMLLSSWALQGDGRTDEALKRIDDFDKNPAFDLYRFYHRALINDLAGRAKDADADYLRTFEAGGSSSIRVVVAYGRFLEINGRPEDAANVYGEFSRIAQDHPLMDFSFARLDQNLIPEPIVRNAQDGAAEALYGLASALAQDRTIDLPYVYLQLTLYMRDDLDVALMLLANLNENVRRWRTAIDVYERVPQNSGLYHHAQLQVAYNLERLDKPKRAIKHLRRMADANEQDFDALVALGDLLRGQEKFENAVETYDQAITLVKRPAKRHWPLYYARGISLERSKRWDEAEVDFMKALELEPDQPLVLNYLGYTWIEQRRRLDEALAMIKKAVELRPNDGYIVDSLGWAYYQLEQYELAVQFLEAAVSLRPADPIINDHLGDAYWRTDRGIEARFQWRRSLTLEPQEEQIPVIKLKIDHGLDAGRVTDLLRAVGRVG